MKVTIIILLAAVFSCHALSTEQVQNEWNEYRIKFGKTYKSPIEMRKRMTIFAKNLEEIEAHNARYQEGLESFMMGLTQFTDLTADEFMQQISRPVNPDDIVHFGRVFEVSKNIAVPESIDWRDTDKVSQVKDQGLCGSCWSFSSTGAVESLLRIRYNRSIDLSEQNLIDCAIKPDYNNLGCNGGFMTAAFRYIKDKGIETENEYPYEGVDGQCRQKRIVAQINDYVDVSPRSEEKLREAVGTIGPVSVGISVGDKFQNYVSGILDNSGCAMTINHGVLAVGYGNENGKDYWMIKNSWGTNWGDKGYVKIARNADNTCKISSMASYPVLY